MMRDNLPPGLPGFFAPWRGRSLLPAADWPRPSGVN